MKPDPDARFVCVWHGHKPGMDVVLVLYRGRAPGWFITYSVRWGQPQRIDTRTLGVPGGTEDQAIAATDDTFKTLTGGTTKLGGGWSEPRRVMVGGDRAAVVAALKSLDLDEDFLN